MDELDEIHIAHVFRSSAAVEDRYFLAVCFIVLYFDERFFLSVGSVVFISVVLIVIFLLLPSV